MVHRHILRESGWHLLRRCGGTLLVRRCSGTP
jgi:hypothetical protein